MWRAALERPSLTSLSRGSLLSWEAERGAAISLSACAYRLILGHPSWRWFFITQIEGSESPRLHGHPCYGNTFLWCECENGPLKPEPSWDRSLYPEVWALGSCLLHFIQELMHLFNLYLKASLLLINKLSPFLPAVRWHLMAFGMKAHSILSFKMPLLYLLVLHSPNNKLEQFIGVSCNSLVFFPVRNSHKRCHRHRTNWFYVLELLFYVS